MVDFSFIGKEGLIIDYEDIVSMIGVNILKYFKSKNVNDKINKMSVEDILLSYLNRQTEDISEWLKTFDIDNFNMMDYNESIKMLQPNLLYSYKLFLSAYKNGIKNLIVHSQYESNTIREYIKTYQVPIEYVYGDILPILETKRNYTYTTSSPTNIKKCLSLTQPIALVIVDDYMHLSDIVKDKIPQKLNEKNVYTMFTSVISAGFI